MLELRPVNRVVDSSGTHSQKRPLYSPSVGNPRYVLDGRQVARCSVLLLDLRAPQTNRSNTESNSVVHAFNDQLKFCILSVALVTKRTETVAIGISNAFVWDYQIPNSLLSDMLHEVVFHELCSPDGDTTN